MSVQNVKLMLGLQAGILPFNNLIHEQNKMYIWNNQKQRGLKMCIHNYVFDNKKAEVRRFAYSNMLLNADIMNLNYCWVKAPTSYCLQITGIQTGNK